MAEITLSTSSRVAHWARGRADDSAPGGRSPVSSTGTAWLRYPWPSSPVSFAAALTTEAGLNALLSLKIGEHDAPCDRESSPAPPGAQTVTHVDFQVVRRDEIVAAEVRIALIGDSEAVHHAEGVIDQEMLSLQIKAKPGDVPVVIEVDISALEVGDSLRVSDIVLRGSHDRRPIPSRRRDRAHACALSSLSPRPRSREQKPPEAKPPAASGRRLRAGKLSEAYARPDVPALPASGEPGSWLPSTCSLWGSAIRVPNMRGPGNNAGAEAREVGRAAALGECVREKGSSAEAAVVPASGARLSRWRCHAPT